MSKLPKENQFLDLSDYGRPFARIIAKNLKNTSITTIQVTVGFIISGCIAIFCILHNFYIAAALFMILKSILDAADGELARIKETPSYVGRYFDSIADIILNFLILLAIWHITEDNLVYTFIAFLGIQLQGTLYNYYYVILRNQFNGDKTSRIFEDKTPIALPGEDQENVNILFKIYKLLYGAFDKTIYFLDENASKGKSLPKWLMTFISTFGLGFQLLQIGVMLILNLKDFIIPYFIFSSLLIFVFISIRKIFYS